MSFGYNNNYGFYPPYPYGQSLYQPPMQQPVQQIQQAPQDERVFVANEAAANAFRVAAGSSVRLWDSSRQTFYEKSAGNDGREYPMLIYDYQLRQAQEPTPAPATDLSKYVTREEMEQRLSEIRPREIKVKRKEVEENV